MTSRFGRATKAQSLLETVIGISFLVPIFVLLVDLTIIFSAVQANDAACRNVVRTVATGAPEDADNRAFAILSQKSHAPTGWLSDIVLAGPVTLSIKHKPPTHSAPDETAQFNPGGPIQGFAMASTKITIKTILVHLFCGEKELTFTSQQSCPISYIVPPTGRSKAVEE